VNFCSKMFGFEDFFGEVLKRDQSLMQAFSTGKGGLKRLSKKVLGVERKKRPGGLRLIKKQRKRGRTMESKSKTTLKIVIVAK